MDRSSHSLLTREGLAEVFTSNVTPGWRSLLGAAAGSPRALEWVARALTPESLDLAISGTAVTPSLIAEHVEALAAGDAKRLSDMVRGWRAPSRVVGDPFWGAAWHSALRHLTGEGLLSPDELSRAGEEVRAEATLLWPTEPARMISWTTLLAETRSPLIDYARLRTLERWPLSDASISESLLQRGNLLLLRVLRGRYGLLDASAVSYLEERASVWDLKLTHPLEAAILAEVLSATQSRVCDLLRGRVAASVGSEALAADREGSLRDLLPLAYVLVSAWRVP